MLHTTSVSPSTATDPFAVCLIFIVEKRRRVKDGKQNPCQRRGRGKEKRKGMKRISFRVRIVDEEIVNRFVVNLKD